MKQFFKILGVLVLAIVLIYIGSVLHTKYLIETGQLVNWQGTWYNTEELKAMLGEQYYEVEAKNTPEQVYTEFRQALLDNDLEKALSLMTEDSRDEYREAFKDQEKFDAWLEKLPEEIVKESEYGNFSSFYYTNAIDKDDNIAHPVRFVKNIDGYWEIDKI